MTELTGIWAQKLKDWGIDPDVAANMDPEPPGEVLCVCEEGDPPCQGNWRIVAQDDVLVEIQCDVCGYEGGIPTRLLDAKLRRHRLFEAAGLPPKFIGLRFDEDNTNHEALELLRSWLAQYKTGALPAPAIWGAPGRGKTHLLTALCTRLIREHEAKVMFHSVRDLLRELQRFDDETGRSEIWHRAVTVDVLALDDLGAEQLTGWRSDQIAHLIDERYQAEVPILLATNFQPASWEKRVDERTASRLAAMTIPVFLGGDDRRQR